LITQQRKEGKTHFSQKLVFTDTGSKSHSNVIFITAKLTNYADSSISIKIDIEIHEFIHQIKHYRCTTLLEKNDKKNLDGINYEEFFSLLLEVTLIFLGIMELSYYFQ
jgi:hypothetical protein